MVSGSGTSLDKINIVAPPCNIILYLIQIFSMFGKYRYCVLTVPTNLPYWVQISSFLYSLIVTCKYCTVNAPGRFLRDILYQLSKLEKMSNESNVIANQSTATYLIHSWQTLLQVHFLQWLKSMTVNLPKMLLLLEQYLQVEMICKFPLYLSLLLGYLPFLKFPWMVHSGDILQLQE